MVQTRKSVPAAAEAQACAFVRTAPLIGAAAADSTDARRSVSIGCANFADINEKTRAAANGGCAFLGPAYLQHATARRPAVTPARRARADPRVARTSRTPVPLSRRPGGLACGWRAPGAGRCCSALARADAAPRSTAHAGLRSSRRAGAGQPSITQQGGRGLRGASLRSGARTAWRAGRWRGLASLRP